MEKPMAEFLINLALIILMDSIAINIIQAAGFEGLEERPRRARQAMTTLRRRISFTGRACCQPRARR